MNLFTCLIFFNFGAYSLSFTEPSGHTQYKGRYSREISNFVVVVPKKVTHTGDFITHLIPHEYKRSYYDGKKESDLGPADKVHYSIPIDGEDYHLELWPNYNVVSPGMVIETRQADNKMKIRRAKDVQCHYHGKIRGQDVSRSALSTCYGLAGSLRTKRGYYIIEPVSDHDHYSGTEHPHILYKKEELRDKERNCGTLGSAAHELASRALNEAKSTLSEPKTTTTENKSSLTEDKSNQKMGKPSICFDANDTVGTVNVETLVVIDKSMIDYHKNVDVETYALTVMNMACSLFHDATLGMQVNIVIVRIIRLDEEDNEMNLNVSPDADNSLDYFCGWQQRMNPVDDAHPSHHDVAVLLTRINICAEQGNNCGLLGLSKLGGACDPQLECTICEDSGLKLGFVVAHELAHTLGVEHDGEKDSTCNGKLKDSATTVMNPSITMSVEGWSTCSQAFLRAFMEAGYGKCLFDEPADHNFDMPNLLPGVMYGADYQCKAMMVPEAVACDMGITCDSLNCEVPGYGCVETHTPPAQGTACGEKRWCISEHCLEIGVHPDAVDGGWSDWGPWSPCSRTCGSGVTTGERDCCSPRPSHGGRYCVGEKKRHKICSTEPCKIGQPSFRDVQCAEFNDWTYPEDGKSHEWKGFYMHDENPCVLFCKSDEGQIASLKPKVIDGTTCRRGIRDICIGGNCKEIPCDLDLESKAVEDACGVCHGDGRECIVKEGRKFFQQNSKGLIKLLDVPEGTRNIRVEETEPTKSLIVVRGNEEKEPYIKGNELGMFHVPGSKAWLGMIRFKQEALEIPGPITKPLIVFVRPAENVTLKFSMGLPRKKERKVTNGEYSWESLDWSKCSAQCGPGTEVAEPRCVEKEAGLVEDKFCLEVPKPEEYSRPCFLGPCMPRWMVGDWLKECSECHNMPNCFRNRTVYCVKPVGEGEGETDIVPDIECTGEKPKDVELCPVNNINCTRVRRSDDDSGYFNNNPHPLLHIIDLNESEKDVEKNSISKSPDGTLNSDAESFLFTSDSGNDFAENSLNQYERNTDHLQNDANGKKINFDQVPMEGSKNLKWEDVSDSTNKKNCENYISDTSSPKQKEAVKDLGYQPSLTLAEIQDFAHDQIRGYENKREMPNPDQVEEDFDEEEVDMDEPPTKELAQSSLVLESHNADDLTSINREEVYPKSDKLALNSEVNDEENNMKVETLLKKNSVAGPVEEVKNYEDDYSDSNENPPMKNHLVNLLDIEMDNEQNNYIDSRMLDKQILAPKKSAFMNGKAVLTSANGDSKRESDKYASNVLVIADSPSSIANRLVNPSEAADRKMKRSSFEINENSKISSQQENSHTDNVATNKESESRKTRDTKAVMTKSSNDKQQFIDYIDNSRDYIPDGEALTDSKDFLNRASNEKPGCMTIERQPAIMVSDPTENQAILFNGESQNSIDQEEVEKPQRAQLFSQIEDVDFLKNHINHLDLQEENSQMSEHDAASSKDIEDTLTNQIRPSEVEPVQDILYDSIELKPDTLNLVSNIDQKHSDKSESNCVESRSDIKQHLIGASDVSQESVENIKNHEFNIGLEENNHILSFENSITPVDDDAISVKHYQTTNRETVPGALEAMQNEVTALVENKDEILVGDTTLGEKSGQSLSFGKKSVINGRRNVDEKQMSEMEKEILKTQALELKSATDISSPHNRRDVLRSKDRNDDRQADEKPVNLRKNTNSYDPYKVNCIADYDSQSEMSVKDFPKNEETWIDAEYDPKEGPLKVGFKNEVTPNKNCILSENNNRGDSRELETLRMKTDNDDNDVHVSANQGNDESSKITSQEEDLVQDLRVLENLLTAPESDSPALTCRMSSAEDGLSKNSIYSQSGRMNVIPEVSNEDYYNKDEDDNSIKYGISRYPTQNWDFFPNRVSDTVLGDVPQIDSNDLEVDRLQPANENYQLSVAPTAYRSERFLLPNYNHLQNDKVEYGSDQERYRYSGSMFLNPMIRYDEESSVPVRRRRNWEKNPTREERNQIYSGALNPQLIRDIQKAEANAPNESIKHRLLERSPLEPDLFSQHSKTRRRSVFGKSYNKVKDANGMSPYLINDYKRIYNERKRQCNKGPSKPVLPKVPKKTQRGRVLIDTEDDKLLKFKIEQDKEDEVNVTNSSLPYEVAGAEALKTLGRIQASGLESPKLKPPKPSNRH